MAGRDIVEASGLSEDAEAEVRHRCGYGCIRCGVTIYHYAVLPIPDEPGWEAPATVLLCPECYALLRRHPLSAEQYGLLLRRPVLRDPDFYRQHLPFGSVLPHMRAGGPVPVHDVSVPVLAGDQAPLILSLPASGVGALRISLFLSGPDHVLRRVVDANHWAPEEEGWHFAHRESRYVVESDRSDARAELDFTAPGRLTVIRLRTWIGDVLIDLTPDWLEVNGTRMTGVIASRQLAGYRL